MVVSCERSQKNDSQTLASSKITGSLGPLSPSSYQISRGKPNKPIFVAHELGKSLLWMIIILSSSSNETRRQVLAVGMSQSTSKASTGPCVISAEQALSIFLLARQHHCALHLAARLDPQVGISGKAIQDIWSLRTWTHVTRAHWTSADHDRYTRKQQRKRKQHAEFSQHIKLEEGLSLGSSGTSSGHGSVDHSSGNADSQDPSTTKLLWMISSGSSSPDNSPSLFSSFGRSLAHVLPNNVACGVPQRRKDKSSW